MYAIKIGYICKNSHIIVHTSDIYYLALPLISAGCARVSGKVGSMGPGAVGEASVGNWVKTAINSLTRSPICVWARTLSLVESSVTNSPPPLSMIRTKAPVRAVVMGCLAPAMELVIVAKGGSTCGTETVGGTPVREPSVAGGGSAWLASSAPEVGSTRSVSSAAGGGSVWLVSSATEVGSVWLVSNATEVGSVWLVSSATEVGSVWLVSSAREVGSVRVEPSVAGVRVPVRVEPSAAGVRVSMWVEPSAAGVGVPVRVEPSAAAVGVPVRVEPSAAGVGVPVRVEPSTAGWVAVASTAT